MNEQLGPSGINFEQNINLSDDEKSKKIQDITLSLAQTAMKLARTYRVPRYDTESRESDSEHTVMVALHSAEIAAQFFPDLNPYEVAYKALVHELIETVTGDVQTFNISEKDLQKKEQAEDDALELLCSQLPEFTAHMVRLYQDHRDLPSRFVGMTDKTAPVAVDILGPGSMFMQDDYDTHTTEDLRQIHTQLRNRYEKRYPDPELALLHLAREGLMRQFEQIFKPATSVQETLF